MNATPIVEFCDVVKSFGSGVTEVRAVDGISASVHAGEFVAVAIGQRYVRPCRPDATDVVRRSGRDR